MKYIQPSHMKGKGGRDRQTDREEDGEIDKERENCHTNQEWPLESCCRVGDASVVTSGGLQHKASASQNSQ